MKIISKNILAILSGFMIVLTALFSVTSVADELTVNGKEIRSYLPTLGKTKARIPSLDAKTDLHVREVTANLFYVTDGIYQSVFFNTEKGIVVIDAPPSYGEKLPEIIAQRIVNKPIRYLIYSHGHKDHIGASGVFRNTKDLQVIAQEKVAAKLKSRNDPDIIQPNITFNEEYVLTLGKDKIELKNQGTFHSNDADIFTYLPRQKFLIAVDILSPGYVPFKEFEVTSDLHRYISVYDDMLAYDFDFILTGHLGILGGRDDVLESKEYAYDVINIAKNIVKNTSAEKLFGQVDVALKRNSNSDLAYRYYLETMTKECASQIIDRWKNRLAGVDVWADGHCDRVLMDLLMH
jgi:glyoxylase-like metal-dependent hydrolase (beta-lactamase superfamily II)